MKKRSLVLVTVDCLRADRVGFNGYSRPVTPFLDSLAKESVVFNDMIVAGVPTYFSFPAILASRYPLGLGRGVMGIAPGETTLATTLRDAGYRTAAYLAGNPYLSPQYGYNQGFETFNAFLRPKEAERIGQIPPPHRGLSNVNRNLANAARRNQWTDSAYRELYFWYCQWRAARQRLAIDELRPYPSANVVVQDACSWLRGLENEDFFLWIHLMDPHHPYYPPPEALLSLGFSRTTPTRARFLNTIWNRWDLAAHRLKRYRSEISALYDASVRWVDQQVSHLVATLQDLKRWSDTLFVLTADHGEEFLEHGARFHSPASSSEQLIRVPMLLYADGITPARLAGEPFSQIDLAPTLLDGAGVAVPSCFQGRSRWDMTGPGGLQREPAITETVGRGDNPSEQNHRTQLRLLTIRDRQYKLVLRFESGKDELFDLQNDPGECAPVPGSILRQERARLLTVAANHLHKSRRNRSVVLALRSRVREIRRSLR